MAPPNVLAAFYIAAGIAHLLVPDKLLAITPAWVPFATQLILITGVCEIAGAIALVTEPLRFSHSSVGKMTFVGLPCLVSGSAMG